MILGDISVGALGTLLAGIGAIVAVVVSVLVYKSTKNASRDANTLTSEANKIAGRQADLDIMEATITNLRLDLAAAQTETKQLRADLSAAMTETRKLEAQATTAIANVSILSDFIREHVPDVQFPRLRRVPDVG